MTDRATELDGALEEVIVAARAHLAAVKSAAGRVDDEQVWRSYVTLNNASFAYDQLLLERYGEVTPWETEAITLRDTEEGGPPFLTSGEGPLGETVPDPYPAVISVRQRRDYRVPSVSALLGAGAEAARRLAPEDEEVPAPASVADAVIELIREGDGSLSGLDVPELEPLAGVVALVEVEEALDHETEDGAELFRVNPGDRVVGRLDEEPVELEPATGEADGAGPRPGPDQEPGPDQDAGPDHDAQAH